ncbi:MAG: DNA-processing protein DprA [Bacteroidales bacterium]|jgi:DNA processing protein|nr:DNA-processing protein DprA [Bacteroidales bacterium]
MENTSLLNKIALSLIPKVGPAIARNLISYVGSVDGIFKETAGHLQRIPNIGPQLVSNITNNKMYFKKAEKEIEFIIKNNIKAQFYLDKDYPARLKNCPDAPMILYSKGNVDFDVSKVISIVGTRNATERGIENCKNLIEKLKPHNVIIVSGLAYGIDICAHNAALENGLDTIAVLGHGLDNLYPSIHRPIAKEIINNGALVTDFTSEAKFLRTNFVRRNRIIAGLSDATIVIESAIKGGALITADIANSYNRDVFAFPGRVSDKYSIGCNKLIKSNKAVLIESIADIEYILGWEQNHSKNNIQTKLFIEFSEEEKIVLSALKDSDPVTIDRICLKVNMPSSKVSPILLGLEFQGVVKSLPGKAYKKNSAYI